jgi:hypothetical protein
VPYREDLVAAIVRAPWFVAVCLRREACGVLKSIATGSLAGKLSSSASSSRLSRCFLHGEGFLSSFMTLSVEAASA